MKMPQKAAFIFDLILLLAIHHVHCDFESITHFCCFWFSPHSSSPLLTKLSTGVALVLINILTGKPPKVHSEYH